MRACVCAFVCACVCMCAYMRASESVRVFSCVRVRVCVCAKQQLLSKRGVPFKRAAHCNFAAVATLSMRQRQSSSVSVIGRLQFLRWGFLLFSSRV